MVLDELPLDRYDSVEINKLLVSLGKKFDKSITWDTRDQGGAFFQGEGKPSDKGTEEL